MFDDELSWLFTKRLSATRYIKVKKMGITEILRRIWLFSANKIKKSEFVSKQPTQFIVELNSSLRQIIDSLVQTCSSTFGQSNIQTQILHSTATKESNSNNGIDRGTTLLKLKNCLNHLGRRYENKLPLISSQLSRFE